MMPDLGVLASRLLFAMQREMGEIMEREGFAPLGPRFGAVLAYLDEDGTRATELAQLSGQHKQVIGNLVDDMERLGVVRREPDPTDRRAKLIVPTAEGLARMRRADTIMAAIEERHATALGRKAYDDFKRAFQRITQAVQDPDSD